tara:strand:+ start:1862 stop:3964 length:2103 start_codon:yes stop_codon:yes gene_type:complete
LIYFALKNKQIETFQDTSKRIIVKTADNSYNSLRVFSYNGTSIAYVKECEDNDIGLFYDYNASGDTKLVHKKSIDDIIQIINVFISTNISKTVYLKDDGTVYYKHSDGTQYITNLSDIIQIAPNGQTSFIALTSHNTLIRYDVTAATAATAANDIAHGETDPIVSIQGFKNSTIVMYLTMLGDLKFFNYEDSQDIRIESPRLSDFKVIQFNIPTYSEFSGTSLPPFSCIVLDQNNNSFVKFNNIDEGQPLTLTNATMITTLVIESSVENYECYVVTNDGHLFKFSDDNADYELVNENYVDSDVKNVIAVNDTIYYVKNGAINCDRLDTREKKWFPSSNGYSCVTCGINTAFTDLSLAADEKPDIASDSGGECKCSGVTTHLSKSDSFNAEYNEIGCRDYQDCPELDPCEEGLFSSNIQFTLSSGQVTPGGGALICPICVPCSKTAEEAFQRNPGSIKYGSTHPNNPDSNIPSGSPCYNGTSADNCQYYISQTCTPGTDTVFAKRTMWEDLDNREQYSVTLAGEEPNYKFKPTADDTEPRNDASIGSEDIPGGGPAYDLNLYAGQDDTFKECIPSDDCKSLGSDAITPELFKLISDNQRYDCTNGYKRICDNCSDKYQCVEEGIYIVDFKDDSSADINLNHLLQYCGDRADYKDDFEKFKIVKPVLCPDDTPTGTSSSICPDLFSSTPCPIASCPDLFSSS